MGLAPLKAMKRGALSTPRSARPRSPPPLRCEEGERPHEERGQETGHETPDPPVREVEAPRPQELEETVLALGAVPPSGMPTWGIRRGPGKPRRVRPRWPSVQCP